MKLLILGLLDKETYAITVEERKAGWRLKQESNTECIAIESNGPPKISNGQGDLAYP